MEVIHIKESEQLKQCLAIRREVFIIEQNVPENLEIDEYDQSPESCHHFLLIKQGQPIGAGRFKVFDADTVKLQRIAVLKDFRGGGNGRELIIQMEEYAKQLGFAFSVLDAQCHAEGFYQRLGYTTISDEPFYDANILHVRMKKPLKENLSQ